MRLSLLVLTASICLLPTLTRQAQASTWPKLPEAVQEIYPTVFENQIWVAGGISSSLPQSQGNMTAKVHYWSTEFKQWQGVADLPEGRHHTYLQAVGDKLFAFGGFIHSAQGQWLNTADVLLFDKAKNTWTRVAKMPVPLSETVGAVLNGNIHLVGGRSPHSDQNGQWQHSSDIARHFVFDPTTLTFSEAKPLPKALNSAASVQYQGRWIVLGGRQFGGGNLPEVLEYLVDENRWQVLEKMPEGRAGHAAAVLNNSIYVFGGEHENGVYQDILCYAFATGQWQVVGKWPMPQHGLGAVTLNDEIWLIGGASRPGLAETSALLASAKPLIQDANCESPKK